MSFVGQQRQLPVLKQFLKLYTTISLPKLAGLMDTDEAAVKEQLRVLEVSLFPHGMIPDASHNGWPAVWLPFAKMAGFSHTPTVVLKPVSRLVSNLINFLACQKRGWKLIGGTDSMRAVWPPSKSINSSQLNAQRSNTRPLDANPHTWHLSPNLAQNLARQARPFIVAIKPVFCLSLVTLTVNHALLRSQLPVPSQRCCQTSSP